MELFAGQSLPPPPFNENGEGIYINSEPSLERCLGDIPGGSSWSETIRIEADCGFLAGKCIGHTLFPKSHATSLEKIQLFPDTLMIVHGNDRNMPWKGVNYCAFRKGNRL